MKWSCQNDDFQFAGKVKKKYGYALRDLECLFYEGFSGKNSDCRPLHHC